MVEKPDNSSNNHGIFWTICPGSLELDISWEQFAVFERSAEQLTDGSLSQQAEVDPLAAYRMIKKMLGSEARRAAFSSVTVGDSTCEYTDTEDEVSQSQQAATTLVENLPDGSEAFDFRLRAYPSREDIDILGADPTERAVLLEMRVEPHNLAF